MHFQVAAGCGCGFGFDFDLIDGAHKCSMMLPVHRPWGNQQQQQQPEAATRNNWGCQMALNSIEANERIVNHLTMWNSIARHLLFSVLFIISCLQPRIYVYFAVVAGVWCHLIYKHWQKLCKFTPPKGKAWLKRIFLVLHTKFNCLTSLRVSFNFQLSKSKSKSQSTSCTYDIIPISIRVWQQPSSINGLLFCGSTSILS